ncbi:hypothetical protein J2794_006302 [Paraburkholderia terricola]|nr:hypothetical protein [Paraburkholderia terricola]
MCDRLQQINFHAFLSRSTDEGLHDGTEGRIIDAH